MDETKSVVEDPQGTSNDAQGITMQDTRGEDLDTQIKSVQLPQLNQNQSAIVKKEENRNLDLILDISVPVSVELGRTSMAVKDILNLTHGSIVELDRSAGSAVDLIVRGKLLAQGEVVVVEENFGIKITNICSSTERIKNLS